MELIETINQSRQHLNSGQVISEANAKDYVIEPILNALGWPKRPGRVETEFSVPPGEADYALFSKQSPVIFVEAKRPGNLSLKGETQLFEYAEKYHYRRGFAFLVFTDGSTWQFYIPLRTATDYGDRLFCQFDIQKDDTEKVAQHLEKYLTYENVLSDKARQNATEAYQKIEEENEVKLKFPQIWKNVLKDPPDALCDIVEEAIRRQNGGDCPNRIFVKELIKSHQITQNLPSRVEVKHNLSKRSLQDLPTNRRTNGKSKRKTLTAWYNGERILENNQAETMISVIKAIGIERVAHICEQNKIHLRGVRWVCNTEMEKRATKSRGNKKIGESGYSVDVHLSANGKKKYLDRLAKIIRSDGDNLSVQLTP